MNLLFVVVLGFLAKCSADSFSQNMARGTMVKDLLTTLTTRKTNEDKVRQDISLLCLDKFLVEQDHWWENDSTEKEDKKFVARIAGVLFEDIRQDSTVKNSLRTQMVRVIMEVMQKDDSVLWKSKDKEFGQATRREVISNPDATKDSTPSQRQVQSTANGLRTNLTVPLVYIQIKQDEERPQAKQIQDSCQHIGWNAPGIELMSSSIKFDTSIRYYYNEDKATADRLQQTTARCLHQQAASVRMVDLSGRNYRAAHGQVEVWINTKQ